ncbi:HET-domain-containing protein [Trichodelitschia bisporula]|uniref:HET-domain-containing protein n=1 Tax=Trichodelitschia bisporula TaxID=703511 RepID=A0A6G1I524_9PEZI|nr:HET-domain-containing protein [Trichodelitschia bisporula]
MRLLNVHTFRLKNYIDAEHAPTYTILSHTWGPREVTFEDAVAVMDDQGDKVLEFHEMPSKPESWRKIVGACKQAQSDGYEYIWIDTICIDKSSSAELSEAINSMFQWYERSFVCYAVLEDVSDPDSPFLDLHQIYGGPDSQIPVPRWFTRGWTLQELIAPKKVNFYTGGWAKIGTKESLRAKLAQVTGINEAALHNSLTIYDLTIAHRMSWAAHRQTTRLEDMAYCLIGIFRVNMPLLYGEGTKAFTRLQEELMKESDDHSLFAWETDGIPAVFNQVGILARSPRDFSKTADVVSYPPGDPHEMTNRGLRIRAAIYVDPKSLPYLILRCSFSSYPKKHIGVPLSDDSLAKGKYWRDSTQPLKMFAITPIFYAELTKTVYIHKAGQRSADSHQLRYCVLKRFPKSPDFDLLMGFVLALGQDRFAFDNHIDFTLAGAAWNLEAHTLYFKTRLDRGCKSMLVFGGPGSSKRVILCLELYNSGIAHARLVDARKGSLEKTIRDNLIPPAVLPPVTLKFGSARLSVDVKLARDVKVGDEFFEVDMEWTDDRPPRHPVSWTSRLNEREKNLGRLQSAMEGMEEREKAMRDEIERRKKLPNERIRDVDAR